MDQQAFEGFVGGVSVGVKTIGVDQFPVLVAFTDPTDDPEVGDIAMMGLTAEEFDAGAINAYVLGRDAVALVTRTAWSPTLQADTSPAWAMVAVTMDLPAIFAVKRDVEERWWSIQPHEAPWFLLSSASGLRAAIADHKPIVPKTTTDPALFQRPTDVPQPPLDGQGRL